MQPELKSALIGKLTALADDELILAHRNSEWTGHAPILEEDIALANLAQDELGHAGVWYGLRQALDDSDPDQLVFFREANDWRNVQMLELPKGDWAFTMLRQYLFDAYEYVLLPRLKNSSYQPISDGSAKMRKEEMFHIRHSYAWLERLGLGTGESNQRTQQALDALWPYAQQLFLPLADEALLVKEDIVPDLESVQQDWLALVLPHLKASGLTLPTSHAPPPENRAAHSEHLTTLLADLQEVARAEPEGVW